MNDSIPDQPISGRTEPNFGINNHPIPIYHPQLSQQIRQDDFALPVRQIQNRNYNNAEDYMTAFDIKMYDAKYNEFRQEECTFDFEPFINQQIAIAKNCGHIFHLECIRGYINARFHINRRIQ